MGMPDEHRPMRYAVDESPVIVCFRTERGPERSSDVPDPPSVLRAGVLLALWAASLVALSVIAGFWAPIIVGAPPTCFGGWVVVRARRRLRRLDGRGALPAARIVR